MSRRALKAAGPETMRFVSRSVGTRRAGASSVAKLGLAGWLFGNLYVHLTQAALLGIDPAAVCRVEGLGPITARTVRDWLGRTDVSVVVRPVAIPGDAVPVDGYEIPFRIREALRLRNPASAFPYSACTSRGMQADHSIPYLPMSRGGPPGQTAPDKLDPLAGGEHNLKTHSGW